MVESKAVGIGGSLTVLAVTVGGVVPLPRAAVWPAVAALLGTGLLGGFVTGTLADGPRRYRARHGFASGVIGGVAFGTLLWYTMTTTGAPEGVFDGINYLVATSGVLSPASAARYDAAIPVALAVASVLAFACCGAGGALLTGTSGSS